MPIDTHCPTCGQTTIARRVCWPPHPVIVSARTYFQLIDPVVELCKGEIANLTFEVCVPCELAWPIQPYYMKLTVENR